MSIMSCCLEYVDSEVFGIAYVVEHAYCSSW